jgi:predicted ATPase/class 3 adenylate cyclase
MPEYPSGTVAFLFTDIEGSTARWESQQQAMWTAVERHFALLRAAIEAHRGVLFKTIGDAVQGAFPTVPEAIAAAAAAQAALRDEDWGDLGPLRVRMAIHVGEATPVDGDYLAPVLNRLSRVLSAGYGDQILLTAAARALATTLPPGHDLHDLGQHRLRDLLEAERIYQLAGPDLPSQFPPLKSLDRQPHNLPSQPTEIVGREDELEQLRTLLTTPGTRLVTLTGPGGTGKTRLSVQAAADVLEAFPDGVWWTPLAALTEPALVLEAVAASLGVREQAGQPLLATLSDHLRSRQTLLVLDNLEQVLSVAPLLAELLAAAPGVVLLATSREPLRLRGEREFPVAPLSLPRAGVRVSQESALASPAVQLFLSRAQAVKPDFQVTEENAAAIVAICQRLDGLPLAIELAAARVRLLAPAALLARLEKRLPLLTGGARDLPERQQTLRAAIAWSHDLLAAEEQALFARLAVFSGGFTFAAALAVADAGSGVSIDLLDGIDSLVQKSLLRQSDELRDEPRFTMLETIREFGLEQLAAQPEEESAVRAAHAAYFQEILDGALESEDQIAAYDELELELGNLRAVLDWHERRSQATAALAFATDLSWFWWFRGHLREGQERLEQALRACASAPPGLRAKALSGLGVLLEATGDFDRAKACHEEALALYRDVGDEPGVAEALENLGIIASNEGDLQRSRAIREEVLALRRAIGDQRGIAVALINLGNVDYVEKDSDGAIALYEEARELAVKTDSQWTLSMALANLGGALIQKARGGETDPSSVAEMEARGLEYIRESLGISRDMGDRERILESLLMLADIAAPNEPRQAAMLLGAADALARSSGHQIASADPDQYDRVVAAVRAGLGEAAFDAAWQEGERQELDDLLSVALGAAQPVHQ